MGELPVLAGLLAQFQSVPEFVVVDVEVVQNERLNFRDRVGLVTFAANADLAAAPTWDRMAVLRELALLPRPEGGTEFNNNIFLSARYLRQQARPGTRRAIVILTDNLGHGVVSNHRVRNELWEADTMLSGLLFANDGYSSGNADIRPFAKETGGDLLRYVAEALHAAVPEAGDEGARGEGICPSKDGLRYWYTGLGWTGEVAIGCVKLGSLTHRKI